jgi:hypothetical protein
VFFPHAVVLPVPVCTRSEASGFCCAWPKASSRPACGGAAVGGEPSVPAAQISPEQGVPVPGRQRANPQESESNHRCPDSSHQSELEWGQQAAGRTRNPAGARRDIDAPPGSGTPGAPPTVSPTHRHSTGPQYDADANPPPLFLSRTCGKAHPRVK